MDHEGAVIDLEGPPQTALAVVPPQAQGLELWSPEGLREMITREIALREIMLEYMRGQMKRGQHYYTRQDFGRRDGEEPQAGMDDKPSLKKEGALNLCHLLHCRPVVAKREQTFHPDGHYTVTTAVQLISLRTGAIVGEGEGLCTTMESKHAWRWIAEWNLPEADRVGLVIRKVKIKKGQNRGQWMTLYRVANTALADVFNAVLKVSYKRGLVAGVLTLPLASELFTQDVEDLDDGDDDLDEGGGPDETQGSPRSQPRPPRQAKAAPASGPEHPTAAQLDSLIELAKSANVDLQAFGLDLQNLLVTTSPITKRYLREHLTLSQYQVAWDAYAAKVQALVAAEQADADARADDDDVPLGQPPAGPADGSSAPPLAERIRSGAAGAGPATGPGGPAPAPAADAEVSPSEDMSQWGRLSLRAMKAGMPEARWMEWRGGRYEVALTAVEQAEQGEGTA